MRSVSATENFSMEARNVYEKIENMAEACETRGKSGNKMCGSLPYNTASVVQKTTKLFDHKPKESPPKKNTSLKLHHSTLLDLINGMHAGLPSLLIPQLK